MKTSATTREELANTSVTHAFYVQFPYCKEGHYYPYLLIRGGAIYMTDRESASLFTCEREAETLASKHGGHVSMTQGFSDF